MSDSERKNTQGLLEQLERTQSGDLSNEQAALLLKQATRLYSEVITREGFEVPLGHDGITATDVVVAVSALLRAQELNPFDLTLWFGQAVLEQPQAKARD
tara:strand:- start:28585 stop:28884 length:300 start_codon:yes stop_codon:yes gene_type:complete